MAEQRAMPGAVVQHTHTAAEDLPERRLAGSGQIDQVHRSAGGQRQIADQGDDLVDVQGAVGAHSQI